MPYAPSRQVQIYNIVGQIFGPAYRPVEGMEDRLIEQLSDFIDRIPDEYEHYREPLKTVYLDKNPYETNYDRQLVYHGRAILASVLHSAAMEKGQTVQEFFQGYIEYVWVPDSDEDNMVSLAEFKEILFGSANVTLLNKHIKKLGINVEGGMLTGKISREDAERLYNMRISGEILDGRYN